MVVSSYYMDAALGHLCPTDFSGNSCLSEGFWDHTDNLDKLDIVLKISQIIFCESIMEGEFTVNINSTWYRA